jgi:RNA-binding protein 26
MLMRQYHSSDADADVLADYVLALLRHDGDMQTVRRLCEEEIPDFLKEGKTYILRAAIIANSLC